MLKLGMAALACFVALQTVLSVSRGHTMDRWFQPQFYRDKHRFDFWASVVLYSLMIVYLCVMIAVL
jgi:hypothetical protein